MEETKYDVFISCKSEDYEKAMPIYNWLIEKGCHPFFAPVSLRLSEIQGESIVFGDEIDDALEQVESMIVFTSNSEYVRTGYVKDEWRTFVEELRSGRKLGSLVTILDGVRVADLPIRLRTVQSFTLSNYSDGIDRFLKHKQELEIDTNKVHVRENKEKNGNEQLLLDKWISRKKRKDEQEKAKIEKRMKYKKEMIEKYGSLEEWYAAVRIQSSQMKEKQERLRNLELYPTTQNGLMGFTNKEGKIIIPCKWKSVYSFSESLALVQNDSNRYGYINKKGKLVIPCMWKNALSFKEGMARIMDDRNYYGYINVAGLIIINCQWKQASDFHSDGFAEVVDDNSNYHLINKKGKIIK